MAGKESDTAKKITDMVKSIDKLVQDVKKDAEKIINLANELKGGVKPGEEEDKES